MDEYNQRDVLLLSQLLHINNINTLEKLQSSDDDLIDTIIQSWKHHVIYKLEPKKIQIKNKTQLSHLYKDLLEMYNVSNTVDLANTTYFGRMIELENNIELSKEEFKAILKS